jgi:hypothetical protein
LVTGADLCDWRLFSFPPAVIPTGFFMRNKNSGIDRAASFSFDDGLCVTPLPSWSKTVSAF